MCQMDGFLLEAKEAIATPLFIKSNVRAQKLLLAGESTNPLIERSILSLFDGSLFLLVQPQYVAFNEL